MAIVTLGALVVVLQWFYFDHRIYKSYLQGYADGTRARDLMYGR